jgi:D-sedoheptulose 7-phosphate isomerase
MSQLSGLGNDFGYAGVFVEQLAGLLQRADVVIAISASGNSPNLLRAVDYANGLGAATIALVGFDGGKLASLAHVSILVKTQLGYYGPVEDVQLAITHILTSYLTLAYDFGGSIDWWHASQPEAEHAQARVGTLLHLDEDALKNGVGR